MLETFGAIDSGSRARIAAAFTLRREDVIPDMFLRLVADLSQRSGGRLALLRDHLERHIHSDAQEHGPMAARLLEEVCGDDAQRCCEAHAAASSALCARARFWSAIADALPAAPANELARARA